MEINKRIFCTVMYKSRKYFKRWPGFDPITSTFSENSNYYLEESLLEVLQQNIAG